VTHVLLAAGDLAMDRDVYDESFVATRDVLAAADITFGQLETSFASAACACPRRAMRCSPVPTVRRRSGAPAST